MKTFYVRVFGCHDRDFVVLPTLPSNPSKRNRLPAIDLPGVAPFTFASAAVLE